MRAGSKSGPGKGRHAALDEPEGEHEMPRKFSHPRRTALVRAGSAIAAALAAWALPWQRRSAALAQGALPHLMESDPTAQALMYVQDATTSTSDTRQESAFCHNCRYFKGEEGAEWGPCQIFPQNSVFHEGWCNVWVARDP